MSDRGRRDDGTALLLMPAGVLIVLLLGAIAVDSALAFLAERELADLTAAAANDAATSALDEDVFYRCGRLRIAADDARAVAAAVVHARRSDAVTVTGLHVAVHNDRTPPEAEVSASGTVRLMFTPTLPGRGRIAVVQARSVAVPQPLGVAVAPTRC